jgi:hypothetical protein
MRIAKVAAWSLILLLAASSASAKTIYVNNVEGDNRFNGQTPVYAPGQLYGPVRSIAKALAMAESGDTISLADAGEPYKEMISLIGDRLDGDAFSRLTIEGNGAVLDGSAAVPVDSWEHQGGWVHRFHPRYVSHQQLFLNDRPLERVVSNPWTDEPPKLKPLQWCLHGGFIYFHTEVLRDPWQYDLSYAYHPTGATLFHCDSVTIRDLTIQGFQLDGINAFNSAKDITLEGVTCRGNGRSGLAVGPCSDVLVNGCLIGDNGECQLLAGAISATLIVGSEVIGNTGPAWSLDPEAALVVDGKTIDPDEKESEPPQTL